MLIELVLSFALKSNPDPMDITFMSFEIPSMEECIEEESKLKERRKFLPEYDIIIVCIETEKVFTSKLK